MLRFFIRLGVFASAALVLTILIGANQLYRIFLQHPQPDASVVPFTIQSGESFEAVAKRLREEHLIASAFWFRVTAEFAGLTDDVKPGTTLRSPRENYAQILADLTRTTAEDFSITFPEGLTIKEMGELVEALFEISPEEWEDATGASSPLESHPFVVQAKKPGDVDLEGYLFPDTYRFYPDASAEDIVRTLVETMEIKVSELDAPTGDAEGMTIHEILTLASIVEREVRKPSEMQNVADIFLKRLEMGMPLQADSTVNYVTGGDDPSISLTDRDIDSPYNTYKYLGLPPGPISNPGLNAISAVLHPSENDYLYFLTDEEGNVYYAETFAEHVENKAKYLP